MGRCPDARSEISAGWGTAAAFSSVGTDMIPPLTLPSPVDAFVSVPARFPDPALAVVTIGGLKLLVDSGCPQTLVREDRIGRDGTISLPGSAFRLRPLRLKPAELERPSRLLGADGILGNDALGRLSLLLDYRNGRVYMRGARGASLSNALEDAGLDADAPTVAVPIERDREGWYRTEAVPGDDGKGGAVWDTGATSYAIGRERDELGPPLGFVDVQAFLSDSRRPIHLTRLDLPGAEPIAMLGFRLMERREPATIGPYALSREWSYLDEARGVAIVPRPDPDVAARRAVATLLGIEELPRRVNRATGDAVDALAVIGGDGGLDRARRAARRLVQNRN